MKNNAPFQNYVFNYTGAFVLFMGLIVGFFFIGGFLFLQSYISDVPQKELTSSMLFFLVSYLATLLFPILAFDLIVVRRKRQKLNFNMRGVPWYVYLVIFPLMFGMMLISEFVIAQIPVEGAFFGDLYEQLSKTIATLSEDNAGIILLTSFFAPLLEEILFRGIIQKGMINGGMKPAKAIVLSAIFFGAFHFNPWQLAGAFLLGLVLGWVYHKTQSLLMPILLHAFNNLITSLLLINGKTESFGDLFNLSEWAVLSVGLVIFSVFFYLFYRIKSPKFDI